MPAASSRARASGTSADDDRRVRRLEPEAGAEAVRQADVVGVDGLDPDRVDERDGGHRADPRNHAGEASRRRAVDARRSGGPKYELCTSSPAHHPAAAGTMPSRRSGAHGHERRAARRHQPLVGVADDDVEAPGVERQPARGLGRVDHRHRAVLGGRGGDRVEVGDLAGRHLHRARGHDVRARVDRSGDLVGRHEPHRHAAMGLGHEREEDRGEVDVRARAPPCRRAARRRRGRCSSETVAAVATVSGATRTRVANASRAAFVASPQCSQLVRPARQSASASWSASHAQSGGSP